jgi:hypothetical protein
MLYCLSFVEEILPGHRFPSTDEISNKTTYIRTIYKINNRISIYYDKNENESYIYIRYNHCDNVDLKKIQEDLDRTINLIIRNL